MKNVDEASALSESVVSELRGAFVTGSFLVNPEKAGDVDVVVGESAWAFHLSLNEFEPYFSQVEVAGLNFELQGDEDYEDADTEMYELVSHWRYEDINIIVIKDIYLAAYKAAANALASNPNSHADRKSRVATHQRFKAVIRKMLLASAEDDDIPW